jgi:hypothetical protein
MKTKIFKLLKEAKNQKEINNIVDEFAIQIVFDYDLMDALRDAKQRITSMETMNWKTYQLN